MPRQNRVTPFGDIIATPARGTLMGNRGILHDGEGRLGKARWRGPLWITCLTAFKGRRRPLMAPHTYTELFFLDEAVAFAAGHRPCGECRRADLDRFMACWQRAHGGERPLAADIDRVLHAARVDSRTRRQIRYRAPIDDLPVGTFVRLDGDDWAWLLLEDRLMAYAPQGYHAPVTRPRRIDVEVLTPRPTVAVLAAGYRPMLHESAKV